MELKTVKVGSPEWRAARQLRYALFFKAHSLPQSVLDDGKEEDAFHLVCVMHEDVVAYGRLSATTEDVFQISQMVVAPECQGQGLGSAVLRGLTDLAIARGAAVVSLNARLSAVEFYTAAGFRTVGQSFVSSTTNVEHIAMQAVVSDADQPVAPTRCTGSDAGGP